MTVPEQRPNGPGSRPTYYLTTPIYYPNADLHVGHAYTTVACDALARYHRLRGYDTWFLTGTDEHGQNIQRRAEAAGKTPQQWVDEIVAGIKDLWLILDITHDDFIRTTEPRHKRVVQSIFQSLYDQGDVYLGVYEGLYCARCEAYYTQSQLEEGNLCPVHRVPVEPLEEEAYFFRLSRYADRLLEHIRRHPEFIQPESRRNEMIRFIEQGLEDLCVSRTSFDWGIPVPFNPRHVVYVWVDALSNYITALGYRSDDPAERARFERFWPADLHMVGKEIVRFHTVVWPIILMALGLELPRQVFGHGWLNLGGEKISKSQGNVIDPRVLVRKYGLDAVRYFLLREVPFGADGNYSEPALVARTNADLANDLGNLLHRTVSMIRRFAGGRVPAPGYPLPLPEDAAEAPGAAEPDAAPAVRAPAQWDALAEALAIRRRVRATVDEVEEALGRLQFPEALAALWRLVGWANKYIDGRAPWDLRKAGRTAELGTVLYNVAETLRALALLLRPFLPVAPRRIWDQLGLDGDPAAQPWDAARGWGGGGLAPGTAVGTPEPIFPRIDEAEVLAPAGAAAQVAAAAGGSGRPDEAETGVTLADFRRLDLRVAQVRHAERVPGTSRLLRLEVDLGGETRQLVAGVAERYRPEELVGRNVVIVANLEPAVIRGVESQGMLLAAEDAAGVSLLGPDRPLPPGSKVS